MDTTIWLDLLVAILLAVTVGYCFVLHRRLSTLRGAHDRLHQLLGEFTAATENARSSVGELRTTADKVGQELQRRVDDARALRDELAVITETGNNLADRLDKRLMERKEAVFGGSQPPARRGTMSESERELIEALRQAR